MGIPLVLVFSCCNYSVVFGIQSGRFRYSFVLCIHLFYVFRPVVLGIQTFQVFNGFRYSVVVCIQSSHYWHSLNHVFARCSYSIALGIHSGRVRYSVVFGTQLF